MSVQLSCRAQEVLIQGDHIGSGDGDLALDLFAGINGQRMAAEVGKDFNNLQLIGLQPLTAFGQMYVATWFSSATGVNLLSFPPGVKLHLHNLGL